MWWNICLQKLRSYKRFKKRDVSIKTILTKSGKNFVTPLSISSLSQEKVYEDIFSAENKQKWIIFHFLDGQI